MLASYLRLLNGLENRADGQGLVEYALIILLVAIGALAALTTFGTNVSSMFVKMTSDL